MGYLKDFGSTLEAKLAALPEAERAAIIAFVKQEVLTSYRNGRRDAEQDRPPLQQDERSSKRGKWSRKAPHNGRNYQRR